MDQEKQQEIVLKLSLFEQQMQQIKQQIQLVEQNLAELNSLNSGLDDLKDKKDKEILAPLGRGIFVNARLLSEELIVDVGGRNFVKKSISDTKNILEGQIRKLEDIKKSLEGSLLEINKEVAKVMGEVREESEK